MLSTDADTILWRTRRKPLTISAACLTSASSGLVTWCGIQRREAILSVLRSLAVQTFALDDYPQQTCSVVSARQLSKRFPDLQGENGVGLVMEHDRVRLDPARRLVGLWDFYVHGSVCPDHEKVESRFNAIEFLDGGRFLVSTLSVDKNEALDEGRYEINGEELLLSYDGARSQEHYRVELDHFDNLLLRTPNGWNAFRRPTDVPESWRNKTGISASTTPE